MALEPKPRPRAFRISPNTEASADMPPGPLVIETYSLDLLDGAQGDVLDRSPPPELQ